MAVFNFVDEAIDEESTASQLSAHYTLQGHEEFLQDHFKGFPVMPGVLMLESLKQAAVLFLSKTKTPDIRYRLGCVEDAKFGQFVKPGSLLKVTVRYLSQEDSMHYFDGRIDLIRGPEGSVQKRALSARLALVEL